MVAVLPAHAWAQCVETTDTAVTCTGTASDGYVITRSGTALTVDEGASLNTNGPAAITVAMPATASFQSRYATITVNGAVSNTGTAGIAVLSGPADSSGTDFAGSSVNLTVGENGTVAGAYGITLAGSPGNPYGSTWLSIANAGTITGTSGVAIYDTNPNFSFNTVYNNASGFIGAIQANAAIRNIGTIDGGALSAIAPSLGNSAYYRTVWNEGAITSGSASPTIVLSYGTVTNSGTISNTGSGAAIGGASYLTLTNLAGGTISASGASVIDGTPVRADITNSGVISNTGDGTIIAAGSGTLNVTNTAGGVISVKPGNTALSTQGSLNLVNQGTIVGNVLTGSGNSTIDSSQGSIAGNVVFGSGDDVLVGTLNGGNLVTGISGAIDGGAGVNTLKLVTSSDATLSAAPVLPTHFTQLSLAPIFGTTLTVASDYPTVSSLYFDGAGTLLNQARISGTGTVVSNTSFYPAGGTFVNEGTITSQTGGDAYAVDLANTVIDNKASISASGNGLRTNGDNFTNSGTITAGGTAASVYTGSGFSNSGTIRSTGGTALELTYTCICTSGTNSGTIAGATTGVLLGDGILTNTGQISASGTAVVLGAYAQIDNRAGGIITGGNAAVAPSESWAFYIRVYNAGTINGDVKIATRTGNSSYGGTMYVATSGGMLNGNLTLGRDDVLMTTLSGPGTSGFAGINGVVQADHSELRYDVTGDASATLALPSGFARVGYQVASGTTLALHADGTWGSTVSIAGTGNVVLSGTVATTDMVALGTTSVIPTQATGYNGSVASIPATITNTGTLATTRSGAVYPMGTVALPTAYYSYETGTTFINNGTVRLTDTSARGNTVSYYGAVTAQTVVNAGTIVADGGLGVTAHTLTNTGSITASQSAVQLIGTTVSNSGALVSTGGAAIAMSSYGYYSGANQVTNLAGGTITGVGDAVEMGGGLVRNAGVINGTVDLGYSPYYDRAYSSGVYIADGGTISANLLFGDADDQLIETGASFGVSGTIDGGAGTNTIGHLRTGTATVTLGEALPTGFTQELTIADGAAAQVTLAGPSGYTGNILVAGTGTIINQLATTGGVSTLSGYNVQLVPGLQGDLAGFVNRADIGRAWVATALFDNSASIGSPTLTGSAVAAWSRSSLTFNNSGSIGNNGVSPAVDLAANTFAGSNVTNSGVISGGLSIVGGGYSYPPTAEAGTLTIANSGTITGFTPQTDPDWYGYGQPVGYAVSVAADVSNMVSFDNSGRIVGNVYLLSGNATLINSGSITGDIVTRSGDDRLVMNGAFAGSIYAGGGTNVLEINGGSQATPVALDTVIGVSSLTQSGGFATLANQGSFGSVVLTGGRLVGLAGSVMYADSITVGRGAVFGSAGTVNGNLTVNGTLSPGASPGTMTVNGNVLLVTGSTTVFEIAPSARDKLNINGTLTINSGSTLQIVATTPVKVGSTLDLISASGGVTGQFDTVTGLAGSLRTLANGDLGLLVQFANAPGYAPQVRRAIDYINTAMAAADAPVALFPALDSLQDSQGAPIVAAFARLTPEPYADALQIGTETALALASTSRTMGEAEARGDSHVFGFGQMVGGTRQFSANGAQGVSAATLNGYGGLVGLGVGGEGYAVAAYVGWMDRHQTIASLGASTKASGAIGGVTARFGGKTRVTLSASYDDADAFTRRTVPDAGVITASYSLPSWSFDASLSRTVPLGSGWLLRPQVGTTWVRTSHEAIQEASAHPFALDVARARLTQGFVDAGLGFETAPDAASPWRRFVTLGMRYRVQGRQARAFASLAGSTDELEAVGVRRNRLSASLAAGVEYQMAPGATLFLTGSGELGAPSNGGSATAGLRFRL